MDIAKLYLILKILVAQLGIPLELFAVLIVAIAAMFIWILLPTTHDPQLERKLKAIEDRLIVDPDNARLLLAKAEILFRYRTSYSCFHLLERAYELGVPLEEIEPTYWVCYRSINGFTGKYNQRVHPDFFKVATTEAPTLTLKLAVDIPTGDRRCFHRIDKFVSQDNAARQRILDSVDTLLIAGGDTASGIRADSSGEA